MPIILACWTSYSCYHNYVVDLGSSFYLIFFQDAFVVQQRNSAEIQLNMMPLHPLSQVQAMAHSVFEQTHGRLAEVVDLVNLALRACHRFQNDPLVVLNTEVIRRLALHAGSGNLRLLRGRGHLLAVLLLRLVDSGTFDEGVLATEHFLLLFGHSYGLGFLVVWLRRGLFVGALHEGLATLVALVLVVGIIEGLNCMLRLCGF